MIISTFANARYYVNARLRHLFLLFLISLLTAASSYAQEFSSRVYSIADTNRYGHLSIHHYPDWQFSFEAPSHIKDGKNLVHTQNIPSLYSMSSLRHSQDWKNYGWFELELVIDSSLVGKPFILSYSSSEAATIWLNGVPILHAGNPSPNPTEEVLSRFVNPIKVGVTLRPGANYILMEVSSHTITHAHLWRKESPNGFNLMLFKHYESAQRRERAFIFGGAMMLLINLVLIHLFLAYRVRGSYHVYVALMTFFMLLHAFTTLSDTLIDWTSQYAPFSAYSYGIAFQIVVYFFLIALRKFFEQSIPWKTLTSILFLSCITAIILIRIDFDLLGYLHLPYMIAAISYGGWSLRQVYTPENRRMVWIIAAGLFFTLAGTFLYVGLYLVMGIHINELFYLSILLSYTSIPVSLTLIVAFNYARLISSLEEKVQDRTAKLEASNEFQKRFFANVSHEFRTPLTISEGLIDKLLRKEAPSKESARYDLSIAKRNMVRLHDMVNQIIELTKADHNELIVHKKLFRASELVSICVESFRSLAEHHGHTYHYAPLKRDAVLHADPAHIEMILNNLISNAIKYTPDAGLIQIHATILENLLQITICDTGKGIPAELHESVFERFHRIKQTDGEYVEGMGVGLELSRMLARMHGGDIVIRDNQPKGACFVLTLPLSEQDVQDVPSLIQDEVIPEPEPVPVLETVKKKAHRILLVEDNEDLRHYITGILQELGEIEQATNGLEALDKVEQFKPDIIITDLMMPKLSGMELVARLAAHSPWKDIPVVVLTAKALDEEKTKLLRIGVVDYITKPFSAEQLVLKTGNLLRYYDQKRTLKEQQESELLHHPQNEFAEKVAAFITEHIQDSGLSVDSLAATFSMSRSTFYRSLEAETGMSPSEFIREVRLTKARALVSQNNKLRLEELANAVGYKSATSFRKMYQDRFGEHPISGVSNFK